jgi:hypothetical protein
MLWSFEVFCGLLEYFVVIWSILWSFGVNIPILVCHTKKNLRAILNFTPVPQG